MLEWFREWRSHNSYECVIIRPIPMILRSASNSTRFLHRHMKFSPMRIFHLRMFSKICRNRHHLLTNRTFLLIQIRSTRSIVRILHISGFILRNTSSLFSTRNKISMHNTNVKVMFPTLHPIRVLVLCRSSRTLNLVNRIDPNLRCSQAPRTYCRPSGQPSLLLSFYQ